MFGSSNLRRRRRVELLHDVRCPECGAPMAERNGKEGPFYGCGRFPICIGTRPKGGERDDSYTSLLKKAYTKAVQVASGPAVLGFAGASAWFSSRLRGVKQDHVSTDDTVTMHDVTNALLENIVDEASALVSEKSEREIDFLVLAHEERMEAMRHKLKFELDPHIVRRMPPASIHRRYDTSALDQLEASITTDWQRDGKRCPACSAWSELILTMPEPTKLTLLGPSNSSNSFEVGKEVWDCGHCGLFWRLSLSNEDEEEDFSEKAKAGSYVFGKNVGVTGHELRSLAKRLNRRR